MLSKIKAFFAYLFLLVALTCWRISSAVHALALRIKESCQ